MITRKLPWLVVATLLMAACGRNDSAGEGSKAQAGSGAGFDRLDRAAFNARAADLALPIFWRSDANGDKAVDPDELAMLWGVPGAVTLADYIDAKGKFNSRFVADYRRLVAKPDLSKLEASEQKRRQAVLDELAQGRPTLVESDLRDGSAEDKALADNVLAAATIIEQLYQKQMGVAALADDLPPDDTASRMLFYRNNGPFCEAPKTQNNPDCSALPSRPKKRVGLYPANLQNGKDTMFCGALEQREDADSLLDPFVIVGVKPGGKSLGDPLADELVPVPYNAAYKREMEDDSSKLMAAAAAIDDPAETPLKLYLATAAESFLSNDWKPADEAWARMSATNSKWYLRVGPDEVYEDPCARKALFHLTFARINPEGLEWQRKLDPRKADMEAEFARLAGPPYAARQVTFHVPDFIDIVLNAGEDRRAFGATIGESLPNWGPVAREGRGRTVAMVNLYTDADSEASWRTTSASLYCPATMEKASFDPKVAVMSTVLHELAHNLGPSHEYAVNGQTDEQIFGGPLSSMLEELKAQTSALWLTDWLVAQGLIDQATADNAHLKDLSWAFGHVAEGMYEGNGSARAYSQLSAIQAGALYRQGAVAWRPGDTAANGTDKGCFEVDLPKFRASTTSLETRILKAKASGDRADVEALKAEFVDGKDDWSQLRDVITERMLRTPKASFVYSINR
jgi:hypothetical protein